jgi:hypothetical protein
VSLFYGLYRKRAFETARMRAFAASGQVPRDMERTEPLDAAESPLKRSAPPTDIIQEPPRDSKVPAWVKQALMRGLALEPGARFGSMRELLEALSQERRLAKRKRWMAAAATVGVGLAVVGGAVYRCARAPSR